MSKPLRMKVPETDQELEDWQRVHNTVIPHHELSLDDVRDRVRRQEGALQRAPARRGLRARHDRPRAPACAGGRGARPGAA